MQLKKWTFPLKISAPAKKRRSVSGKRADLNNQFFRSKMEANFARYLNRLVAIGGIQEWRFEHPDDEFWFDDIKRGTRSYKADFRVVEMNGKIRFYETKGWMDRTSKTKLKRMEKYHPEIEIVLIRPKDMRRIKRNFTIPNWE